MCFPSFPSFPSICNNISEVSGKLLHPYIFISPSFSPLSITSIRLTQLMLLSFSKNTKNKNCSIFTLYLSLFLSFSLLPILLFFSYFSFFFITFKSSPTSLCIMIIIIYSKYLSIYHIYLL